MIVPHMLRTALLTGVLFLISACAPDATAQPVEYSARVGVVGATSGDLPFWMEANQYGRIDPARPARYSTSPPGSRSATASRSIMESA